MNFQSLVQKLDPFLYKLNSDDLDIVQFAIGRYVLLRDTRVYNSEIKNLYPETKRIPFNKDVKLLLKNDHTIGKVRSAILYALRASVPWEDAASLFSVYIEDILFCWEKLDDKSRKKVRSASKEKQILTCLSDAQIAELIIRLMKYCQSQAYLRLKVLADNDFAYTMDDLVQELLLHAVRTIRQYESFTLDGKTHDVNKIINFTKRAISNYAVNMVVGGVVQSRARVTNITQPCGECSACLSGNITKCKNVVQQYASTTLSLDKEMQDDEGTSLYDIISSNGSSFIEDHEQADYINKIKGKSPENVAKFVDIVLGNDSGAFEEWLDKYCHVSIDYLLPKYDKLADYVAQYLDMNKSIVSKYLL